MGNNQPKPDPHEFAKRFNKALDLIAKCPSIGEGRGVWLHKLFKVSQPSTNGWLQGSYIPTPSRVRTIADMADVSYDWLYFGRGSMTDSVGETRVEYATSPGEPSPAVRRANLKLALKLTAEAEGLGVEFTPDEQSEVIDLLFQLLEQGLEESRVLQVARISVTQLKDRKGKRNGSSGTGNKT